MKYKILVLTIIFGVLSISSCNQTAKTNSNNANGPAAANNTEKKPEKDMKAELTELENQAWTAFQKKDGKFFEGFLADGFVSNGSGGRGTKADTVKEISGSPCEVKSFKLTDFNVEEVGENVAISTSKAEVDMTCEGKPLPSPAFTATVFVKKDGKWMAAYHQELNAADAKPAAEGAPAATATAAKPWEDADKSMTASLSEIDKKLWEAWSKKDTKTFESLITKTHVELNESGRLDHAAALKDVTENKCEVKSHSQEDFVTTKLTDTVSLLTYKAHLDAICDGKPAPKNIWSSSVFVKEGDTWKSAFYVGTPAA